MTNDENDDSDWDERISAPWTWDGSYPIHVVDRNGKYVCGEIMPANQDKVQLICASPDLYAAASLANDVLGELIGTLSSDDPRFVAVVRAMANLGVAMLKAEGQ